MVTVSVAGVVAAVGVTVNQLPPLLVVAVTLTPMDAPDVCPVPAVT